MSHTELIARLRAAEEPDRELDFDLHQIAFGKFFEEHGYKRVGDIYVTATPTFEGAERCGGPEYYTSSIDAALALVEKLLPEANCHGYDKDPNGIEAYVSRNHVPEGHWLHLGHAKTIPLALLIALLVALQKKEPRP